MANLAQKVCGMMEECTKPRMPQQRRPSSASMSTPWAWRALLFSWRRFLKKNPPKPPVIKPAMSTMTEIKPSSRMDKPSMDRSPAGRPRSKRSKSGPIPTNYPTSHNRYFYCSSSPSEGSSNGGSRKGVPSAGNSRNVIPSTKTRSHSVRGPNCASPPTMRSCVYDDPILSDPSLDIHYTLPYFQLHRTQTPPPNSTTARLPIYIVT